VPPRVQRTRMSLPNGDEMLITSAPAAVFCAKCR
jgi:hypothetical protein